MRRGALLVAAQHPRIAESGGARGEGLRAEVALEDVLVEDEAEAGALGWGDVAVLDDNRLDEQVAVERAGVELLEHEVRGAGVELDGGSGGARADVDLDNPDGLLLQGVGEVVLGGQALAGGDGN